MFPKTISWKAKVASIIEPLVSLKMLQAIWQMKLTAAAATATLTEVKWKVNVEEG